MFYKLDQTHFYIVPGLEWQVLLKTVSDYCEHEVKCKDCESHPGELKLGFLLDIVIMLMFEKGIRGRINQAVKRYVKSNSKNMVDLYSLDKISTYH